MIRRLTIVLRIGMLSTSLIVALIVATATQAASTTCSSVAACVFVINDASGPGGEGSSASGYGLEGLSKTNDGVVGETTVNSRTPGSGKAGVTGYDHSTNRTTYNSGVYGVSSYATGVQGQSKYGTGMLALSYNGNGLSATSGSELFSGFSKVGVVAQSTNGAALIAVGNTTGIIGFATLGCGDGCPSPLQNEMPAEAAVSAGTDDGGLGLNIVTDANFLHDPIPSGVGATISSGGLGVMINPDRANNGNPGLVVNGPINLRDFNGGFQGAIIAGYNALSVTGQDYGIAVSSSGTALLSQSGFPGATLFQGASSTGATVAQLDDSGNLAIAGNLTQHGTFTSAVRNIDGTYSAAYGAQSSSPTVEDMGEANLVGGAAYIPIDIALLKAIDISHGYLVFLTPQGQTTGLYVTGKSRAGFAVREIGGARDSIAFDYRIVARPYGVTGQRLAPMAQSIRSGTIPPLFYRHMKPLRFKAGQLDARSLPKPSL